MCDVMYDQPLDKRFYFQINIYLSINFILSLTASCVLCLVFTQESEYKRRFRSFHYKLLKHLKKIHGNVKAYETYVDYKLTKKKSSTCSLKSKHIGMKNPNQQKITDAFPITGTIRQDEFDKRIIKFITSTMSAVNIIENQSFKDLFSGIKIKVMSRNTAMKKINELSLKVIGHMLSYPGATRWNSMYDSIKKF